MNSALARLLQLVSDTGGAAVIVVIWMLFRLDRRVLRIETHLFNKKEVKK